MTSVYFPECQSDVLSVMLLDFLFVVAVGVCVLLLVVVCVVVVVSFSKDVTQTQQQRPESPTVILTWHASKYKGHKLRLYVSL